MNHYLALLRGINVGGNNIIKMTELAAAFQGLGFQAVRTYIQSGNVIFQSPESDRAALANQIESALSERFAYRASLVLRSDEDLRTIVTRAPEGFGSQPDLYRSDVLFLKEPLTPAEVLNTVRLKEGVDQAWPGAGVVYFARLTARAAQSYLTRIIGTPIYQQMTVRNWNTTTKLLEMMS